MPQRKFRVAVLGGTFDRIHLGHERLLAAAFASANEVGVGLTTDRFLAAHPKRYPDRVRRYSARRRSLRRYLLRAYGPRRFWIAPLEDSFGRSVEPGIDLLVVSKETLPGAHAVNAERRRRGLPPLRVLAIPVVLAADGRPLHAERIRAGEVDREGRPHRSVRHRRKLS
ncbi:MAG TPA: pantetheine-phosphate adenylyltransferase [Thermoplasmata archaeon]|nr:pantetheine-phosphate adenylyltransferase [Thermoplasmata archaeon]